MENEKNNKIGTRENNICGLFKTNVKAQNAEKIKIHTKISGIFLIILLFPFVSR